MTKLIRQSLTAYAAPLCETIVDCPTPQGTEVLVRVSRCGVCHSDIHMQDGYFSLAGDKKLDVTAGRALPFTLGHEIAGVIEAVGPDAEASIGRDVAIYPWIGCSICGACLAGEENLCSAPRHLGIYADGGYATHVLIPHSRYLLDYAPLPSAFAGALMCSGLTAYAALKRVTDRVKRGPLLLVGMGGVGMMGLTLARAMFDEAPLVADIDPTKREAALQAGARAAYDPADPATRKTLMKQTGGGFAAIVDFVGAEQSLAFATSLLARGGKVVVTGLLGGDFSMPAAMFSLKGIGIEGIITGTLAEAQDLMTLARKGRIQSPPIIERPLREAQISLDELRKGHVVGRIALNPQSSA
jgi:D-arabinose 1-dehydrogenase-like Zn-dependent alcohol dehydrogenase